jgi:CMP-N,N'-diacetyllegionaminic acid synthase
MSAKHGAPRYLAIVPARGGSKRLPGKNLLRLGGRPLLGYTLEAARAARRLDAVVVSTDSQQIAEYALAQGVDTQGLRPSEISGDTSPVVAALQEAHAKFTRRQPPVDAVILLQPTSPLRTARHIDEAITLFESSGADTVTSVRASREHPSWTWREAGGALVPYSSMREMELDRSAMPRTFVETGAIYVIGSRVLEAGRIYGDKVVGYLMDARESVDIDTAFDLQWAEFLLGGRPPGQGQQ